MAGQEIEKKLSKLLAACIALTTVFLVSESVTDPVNAPKFLILGILSTSIFILTIGLFCKELLKNYKSTLLIVLLFVICSSISVIRSDLPFSQGIYGVYGRNNGLLTYVFLSFLLVIPLTFKKINSFTFQLYALFVAGLVNVVYCLWVIIFGDFIGWSNPYGNILGTLGNPNFIGSFLGIFLGAYVAFGTGQKVSKTFRFSLLLVVPLTIYEIFSSQAIQGRVLAILSFGLIGYFHIRARMNKFFEVGYLTICLVLATFSIMGSLQMGPLSDLVYKRSVSLRGQYWLAAWNTGNQHPFSGVGMDGFGDWYRRMRDIKALEMPGVNVVVNAAHNVPLDMFAFGGWPLLLTYLTLIILTIISIFKILKRGKQYDGTFVALVISWVGYQAQSIISINQIGLAVWGWVLSGLLIAYSQALPRKDLDAEKTSKPLRKHQNSIENSAKTSLILLAGGLAGLLIALPPFLSDSKFRSAQVAQSVEQLKLSLVPGYFNPPSTSKYIAAIQMFEDSKFYELSHTYAVQAVNWNPDNYELWRVLYFINGSSDSDRERAIKNMKRLDPLNINVTNP